MSLPLQESAHITPDLSLSAMGTWLEVLQQTYPPQHTLVIGAGNGTGALSQWLLAQAHHHPRATLLEADAKAAQQLTQSLHARKVGPAPSRDSASDHEAGKAENPNYTWAVAQELILPLVTDRPSPYTHFHSYNNAAENGLLALDKLQAIWPGLQTLSSLALDSDAIPTSRLRDWLISRPHPSTALHSTPSAAHSESPPVNWLLLDCMPAAALLSNTPLADIDVLLARVTLNNPSNNFNNLSDAYALNTLSPQLQTQGLRHIASFTERNTRIVKALFVRDSALLAKANAETTAQLTSLQAQNKELAQAKETEAKAKADALAQLEQLKAEKAKLQTLEQSLKQQLQTLEEEKNQLAQAKDKLGQEFNAQITALKSETTAQLTSLQAQNKELAQAKETEAKAKAEIGKKIDEFVEQLAKANQAKDAQAKLATQRQVQIEQLNQELRRLQVQARETQNQQAQMRVELTRAEAQIDLIKDLLLRDSSN